MRPAPIGAVFGLAIAACFVKPDPPTARDDAGSDPRDASDGSVVVTDGSSIVDAGSNCVRYELDDALAGVCGGWGSSATGSIGISGGQLSITAQQSGQQETASCTSSVRTFQSVTFDVVSVPSIPGTSTELYVSISGMKVGARFDSEGLTGFCGAMTTAPLPWSPGLLRISEVSSNIRVENLYMNTWQSAIECPGDIDGSLIGANVRRDGSGSAVTLTLEYIDVCQ